MLPYKTGTVTITNGTAAVTGVGTFFKSNVAVGDLITVDYLHDYVIISVNSDTSVTLDRLFAEATVTGQAYLVKRVSSSWGMPAKLASDYTELTNQYRARWVAGKGPKGDKGDPIMQPQGTYVSTRTYIPGDYVTKSNKLWLCITVSTGNDPEAANSTYWTELTVNVYTQQEGDPI